MKRYRNLISSGSSSDEMNSPVKQSQKHLKMEDQEGEGGAHQMPQEEVPENVSLKDVFIQLNTMEREINQNFNSLRTNVELLNHELKSDMKELTENVIEIDKSLENAWREVEQS